MPASSACIVCARSECVRSRSWGHLKVAPTTARSASRIAAVRIVRPDSRYLVTRLNAFVGFKLTDRSICTETAANGWSIPSLLDLADFLPQAWFWKIPVKARRGALTASRQVQQVCLACAKHFCLHDAVSAVLSCVRKQRSSQDCARSPGESDQAPHWTRVDRLARRHRGTPCPRKRASCDARRRASSRANA